MSTNNQKDKIFWRNFVNMLTLKKIGYLSIMKITITEILLWLVIFFSPIGPTLITTFTLILVDFFTGIWAANKRGEAITSRKMSTSIIKWLIYSLAIIVSFVVETYILTYIPLVKIISGLISMTELKSFYENCTTITGINFHKAIMEYLDRNKTVK